LGDGDCFNYRRSFTFRNIDRAQKSPWRMAGAGARLAQRWAGIVLLTGLVPFYLLPDTFGETRFFTCLNGQFVAFETLCGAKKPRSSAKNLVSEPRCKKCPVVNPFYSPRGSGKFAGWSSCDRKRGFRRCRMWCHGRSVSRFVGTWYYEPSATHRRRQRPSTSLSACLECELLSR